LLAFDDRVAVDAIAVVVGRERRRMDQFAKVHPGKEQRENERHCGFLCGKRKKGSQIIDEQKLGVFAVMKL
jgi:hypothetical protein